MAGNFNVTEYNHILREYRGSKQQTVGTRTPHYKIAHLKVV
jgi:hypothetical protein